MSVCKRDMLVRVQPGAAAGVDVVIPSNAAEFTIRCVDSAGAGLAWTLKVGDGPAAFHFDAGESWTADRLTLDGELRLKITSAAGSSVELIIWEG